MSSLNFMNPLYGAVLLCGGNNLVLDHMDFEGTKYLESLDQAVTEGFDYYFINNILIIPNPFPEPQNPALEIQIEGTDLWVDVSKWAIFLNYQEMMNDDFLVESLKLPNFKYIKDKLQYRYKTHLSSEGKSVESYSEITKL